MFNSNFRLIWVLINYKHIYVGEKITTVYVLKATRKCGKVLRKMFATLFLDIPPSPTPTHLCTPPLSLDIV